MKFLSNYVRAYLSIVGVIAQFREVFLFDLMCGEGQYEDGHYGSPVALVKEAAAYIKDAGERAKPVSVYLNDLKQSTIEPSKRKVDRALEICRPLADEAGISLSGTSLDISEALKLASSKTHDRALSLFFVDPAGYKSTDMSAIREILLDGFSEVMLFIPVSFINRFKTDKRELAQPARDFLSDIYGGAIPNINSDRDLMLDLKRQFERSLGDDSLYVVTVELQPDRRNLYALFCFSTHELGCERMVDALWKLDPEQGRGHRLGAGSELPLGFQVSSVHSIED